MVVMYWSKEKRSQRNAVTLTNISRGVNIINFCKNTTLHKTTQDYVKQRLYIFKLVSNMTVVMPTAQGYESTPLSCITLTPFLLTPIQYISE